jgi:hypothetical protein
VLGPGNTRYKYCSNPFKIAVKTGADHRR